MRFSTPEESLALARQAEDELRPTISFAGQEIPCRFSAPKRVGRGKNPYTWHDRLSCSACAVPPSFVVSVYSSLTQLGLDATNFIRSHYSAVHIRKRPGDGAELAPKGRKKRRGAGAAAEAPAPSEN